MQDTQQRDVEDIQQLFDQANREETVTAVIRYTNQSTLKPMAAVDTNLHTYVMDVEVYTDQVAQLKTATEIIDAAITLRRSKEQA